MHQIFWLSSDFTAATHMKEWKGRKLPLASGIGPHALSAGHVEAMEKSEKEQKRRANICLMVSEQILGFWEPSGPIVWDGQTMGQGNVGVRMSFRVDFHLAFGLSNFI